MCASSSIDRPKFMLDIERSEIWTEEELKRLENTFKSELEKEAETNRLAMNVIGTSRLREKCPEITESLKDYFASFTHLEEPKMHQPDHCDDSIVLAGLLKSESDSISAMELVTPFMRILESAKKNPESVMPQTIDCLKSFFNYVDNHKEKFLDRDILNAMGVENIHDPRTVPEMCLNYFISENKKIVEAIETNTIRADLKNLLKKGSEQNAMMALVVVLGNAVFRKEPIYLSGTNPFAQRMNENSRLRDQMLRESDEEMFASENFLPDTLGGIAKSKELCERYFKSQSNDERYSVALEIINPTKVTSKKCVPISVQLNALYVISIKNKELSPYLKSMVLKLCDKCSITDEKQAPPAPASDGPVSCTTS